MQLERLKPSLRKSTYQPPANSAALTVSGRMSSLNAQRQFAAPTISDSPPASAERRWLWVCLVVFAFSFAFDYRAPEIGFGTTGSGGSIFQFAMLGSAVASGLFALLIGWRHLLVRPGVYLITFWWAYLAFSAVVAVFQGNELGFILRLLVAPVLIGFGMVICHIALCGGVPVASVIRLFLAVCVVNIFWQTGFYYVTSSQSLLETRPLLSAGIRFIFPWTAGCILLARRIPISTLLIFALALFACVLSLTRGAIIYLAAAFSGAFACLFLAMLFRQISFAHVVRRLGTLAAIAAVAVAMIVIFCLAVPTLGEWWIERFLYSDGGGATTEDMSVLMRKAEAEAMFQSLSERTGSWIWGRGYGAPFYWDDDYLAELFLVYPDRENFPEEIYTAGHNLWTYTTFASGIIGLLCWITLVVSPSVNSLRGVRFLSTLTPGGQIPDLHIAFFPAIALWTLVATSILENPFDFRLNGSLTGIVAAIPQYFLLRAWLLRG